jgi:hypothetical protein
MTVPCLILCNKVITFLIFHEFCYRVIDTFSAWPGYLYLTVAELWDAGAVPEEDEPGVAFG